MNVEAILNAVTDCDALISAVRPSTGNEPQLVLMTESILSVATKMDVPVLIVGGAARLKLSQDSEETLLTAKDFLPEDILPIARACQSQYESCLNNNSANWTYLSPSALLFEGVRTGHFRLGTDTLLTDKKGHSTISMEDFAVAIIDEIETPVHTKTAFTVGY